MTPNPQNRYGSIPVAPVKPPNPKMTQTLIFLGIVLGTLAVLLLLAGATGVFLYSFSGHRFVDGALSVRLEAGAPYKIEENYSYLVITCRVISGPEGAHWDLQKENKFYKANAGSWYTTHTLTTDTTGEYVLAAENPGDASLRLIPTSRSTDWMIFGLPLAFFVFAPAGTVTLARGWAMSRRQSMPSHYDA